MNNLILLTGAGFTKNFGGFLDEKIRNAIKSNLTNEAIIKSLEKNPYEQIYQELNSNSSNSEIIQQFNEAINNAYAKMDSSLQKLSNKNKNVINKFLKKFHYVFTLNQDLFLEKTFGYHSILTNQFSGDFRPINPFLDLSNGKFTYPDLVTSEFEKLLVQSPYKEKFKYIKLHGSYGWKNFDSSNIHIMGVGFNKQSKIWNFLLLRIYLSFFGNRLTDGEGVLVIFGYGFGDMHINDYICWGINKGLRLILIGHKCFSDFKLDLKNAIRKTYSYDNIQLPPPDVLSKEIDEKSKKIINSINHYYSLQKHDILNFLKSLTQKL